MLLQVHFQGFVSWSRQIFVPGQPDLQAVDLEGQLSAGYEVRGLFGWGQDELVGEVPEPLLLVFVVQLEDKVKSI